MRRTVRGTAATLGALAIVAGAAACGGLSGGGDEEGGGEPAVEAEQSEEGADSEGGSEGESEDTGSAGESESGSEEDAPGDEAESAGDAAGEPLTEEDLSAVADRYFEFVQASASSDGQAACGLITDPTTGKPLSGVVLETCAEQFAGQAEAMGIDPSMADALDRSMFEGVDNGDGTAGVSLMGTDGGVTFIKAEDGNWYIDGSGLL